MKKNKRNNAVTALLIVALFCLAIAGVTRAYAVYSETAAARAEAARAADAASNRLYDQVVAIDLANNYPKLPEDVLALYDDTTCLLYDSGVTDPEMLQTLLAKQRELYAPELLELNDFDGQFAKLLDSRKEVLRKKIIITAIEHPDMYFDAEDPELCVISTIMRLKGESDLFFKFYLKKNEDGRYKIILRDATDRNFNRVVKTP